MAKIDKKRLGVDASNFDRASIEFLRADSPIVDAINTRVMEGLNSNFKVIKDDNGHNRPFLVIEYPELYASVAMYMTSSIDEERMAIDNSIRGEHLFRAPFGLYNYISRSSIRGRVESGKMSVIDRSRFLFITADSFVESESRAVDIEDLNAGINTHYNNAHNVSELITLDLAGSNFTDSVRSGKPELWVYKRTERQPIMFNPSAMYLSLAINALERFENRKLHVTPENLASMGELAGDITFAYAEYLRYNDMIRELEEKDPEVYNIFESVRYYASLTKTTFNKIQENKEYAEENGLKKYKYIYGDPVYDPTKPIDKRISFEINRAITQGTLTGKRSRKAIAEQIAKLIKTEKQVSQTLGSACEDVIKVFGKVAEDQRINLSNYAYSKNFWVDFYDHYTDDNYIGSLMDGFKKKYQAIANHYTKKIQDRKHATEQKKIAEKMHEIRLSEAEKVRQERISALKKVLENHYMDLYRPMVREYVDGKLLPCAKTVGAMVEDLCTPIQIDTGDYIIGKKLADKIIADLQNNPKLAGPFRTRGQMVFDAEKKIGELSKSPEQTQMLELVARVVQAEQKYIRTSQKKLDKQATRKIIAEVVDGLSESELATYIDPKFEFGNNHDEILQCMQDVYSLRNTINSFAQLKQKKMDVLDALAEINDMDTLVAYHMTYEVLGELHKGGAVLPNGQKPQTVEEMVTEFEQIAGSLDPQKPLPSKEIIENISQKMANMNALTNDTQELIEARTEYLKRLGEYEKVRANHAKQVEVIAEEVADEKHAERVRTLTELEGAGFSEVEPGVWVEYGKGDCEIWRGPKKEAEKILKDYTDKIPQCLNRANYLDLEADKAVILEVHDACYPDDKKLLSATRAKVAQTRTMKDAIKVYKKACANLDKLTSDMDEFDDMVRGEFGFVVEAFGDIQENLAKWQYLFTGLGESLYRKRKDAQDIGEPWRRMIAEAYRESAKDLCDRSQSDFDRYRAVLRERTRKIANGYQPRTDEVYSLMTFLSKSSVKSQTFDKVALPKSVMSENDGVAISIYNVGKLKSNITDMLTVSSGFDPTNYSDRDMYMGHKVSDLKANRNTIMRYLTDIMDVKMQQIQRIELDGEKKAVVESARYFATLGEEERALVFDEKDGLEHFLRDLIKRYGDKGGRIESSVAYTYEPNKRTKQSERLQYFSFYEVLLENLPKIRKAVEEGTKFEGEVDETYVKALKTMLTAYNKEKGGKTPTLADFNLSSMKFGFPKLPPILQDPFEDS